MRAARTLSVTTVVVLLGALLGAAAAEAQTVTVTSAKPSSGEQGTTLDVTVGGSGFDRSSRVGFYVNGTLIPGGITVNSTRYRNASTLIANITIAGDAEATTFDIEVTTTSGRSGKGTNLFQVVKTLSCNDPVLIPEVAPTPICTGFGNCEGLVRFDVNDDPDLFETANGVALDSSGRIVVAGYARDATLAAETFTVLRLNPDGTLDTTFGNGGASRPNVSPIAGDERAYAVAIQPDGKIVAAGRAPISGCSTVKVGVAVVRLNEDGSLDDSFGSGGRALFNFEKTSDALAYAVALQDDGDIVVAGFSGSGAAIARLTPDGALDSDFGSGGKVTWSVRTKGKTASAHAVAVDSQGRVVTAGRLYRDVLLLRLTPDGAFDSSFGTDGAVVTDVAGYTDIGWEVAVDAQDNVVVAGRSDGADAAASLTDFVVLRYRGTDGSLDSTFGPQGNGVIKIDLGETFDEVRGMALDTSGKIVVAGDRALTDYSVHRAALARITDTGVLDQTFGDGGIAIVSSASGAWTDSHVNALAIGPDSSLVVVGSVDTNGSNVSGGNFLGVLRYVP